MLSKITNVGNIRCKLDELYATFFPLAFWIPYCFNAEIIGNSILQKILWFEQKLGVVCQRAFLLFHGFSGVFKPIPKTMQLSLQNCLLETPGSVIVEFFKTTLCKEVAQQLYRKLPKIVKNLKNLFFQYLGHSE